MSELSTSIGGFNKVLIKGSQQSDLIFIGSSDAASELSTTLGSFFILPIEGSNSFSIETSDAPLELSTVHLHLYIPVELLSLSLSQTLTHSNHRRLTLSSLNPSPGTKDLIVGFRCLVVLWIHLSSIHVGNLQGKPFKNLIV
jgi:hypothetical protein